MHHLPSLAGRSHAVLTHGVGPLHYLMIGLAYVGLVFLLWRLCAPLEGVFARFWFRRWLMTDSGEYARHTHTDAHGPLVESRSRDQRRGEAAVERRARLRRLTGYGLTAGIGAALIWETFHHPAHPFGSNFSLERGLGYALVILFGLEVLIVTPICAVAAAWNLAVEAAYATGLQGWRNARVLDPPAEVSAGYPGGNEPPPFATGGPADSGDVGPLFGGDTARKPEPKFPD